MPTWALFATIYDNFAIPLIALTNGLVSALSAWTLTWMRDAMIVLLVGTMLWSAIKGGEDPISILLTSLVKFWFVGLLLTSTLNLGPQLRDLLLTGIERDVGGALSGASGARMVTGALYDSLWNRAFAGGLRVMRQLPWSVAGVILGCGVLLYWFVALAACVMGFLIWMKAFIMVALLVGLWPLFVAMWLFPWFRFLFWGWLHSVFANVILKLLTTVLLSLVLNGLDRMIVTLLAQTSNGGNEWLALQTLLGGAAMFVSAAWLTYQLPGTAAAISGGFSGYGHLPGFRNPFQKREQAGGAGGSGGRSDYNRNYSGPGSDGSPANDSIPVVRNAPPGQSLSNP
ncbi:hypothetical protein EAH89_25600 [Roseomonas nepalensis]|uniref:Type IV secretion system protein n=1 Tax=Muricoccus nepalensis TaxID=1854500 RepID=A0A502F9J7_9PROT|nr:type IV secretion system protein [Roseomonas nepalensis]TPG46001.1 hypothetical protein EAH89_25600 [Roseomonas nepalensis]